jgi:hypothetical protein
MKYAASMKRGGELLNAEECDYSSFAELCPLCPECKEVVFLRKGGDRTHKKGTPYKVSSHWCHSKGRDPEHVAGCEMRVNGYTHEDRMRIASEARGQRASILEKEFLDIYWRYSCSGAAVKLGNVKVKPEKLSYRERKHGLAFNELGRDLFAVAIAKEHGASEFDIKLVKEVWAFLSARGRKRLLDYVAAIEKSVGKDWVVSVGISLGRIPWGLIFSKSNPPDLNERRKLAREAVKKVLLKVFADHNNGDGMPVPAYLKALLNIDGDWKAVSSPVYESDSGFIYVHRKGCVTCRIWVSTALPPESIDAEGTITIAAPVDMPKEDSGQLTTDTDELCFLRSSCSTLACQVTDIERFEEAGFGWLKRIFYAVRGLDDYIPVIDDGVFYWDESDFFEKSFEFSNQEGDIVSQAYSYDELEEALKEECGIEDTRQELEVMVRRSLDERGEYVPDRFGCLGLFFDLSELRTKGFSKYDGDRAIHVVSAV